MTSLTVWFYRHGEVASHRGDVPVTEGGLRDAETAGERLGHVLDAGSQVEFLHAPTQRTLETLEALRRGISRALGDDSDTTLGAARVEPALRNPDLYVAGTRVEMVSSPESLAEQLPSDLLTDEQVEGNAFFTRFWAQHDRIRVWLEDTDPQASAAPTSHDASSPSRAASPTSAANAHGTTSASRTPARSARSCVSTSSPRTQESPITSRPCSCASAAPSLRRGPSETSGPRPVGETGRAHWVPKPVS